MSQPARDLVNGGPNSTAAKIKTHKNTLQEVVGGEAMSGLLTNSWFVIPVLAAEGGAFIFAIAAYLYNSSDFPKTYPSHSFEGPTKTLSETGIFSAVLPLLGLLSEKVNGDQASIGLLAAMTTVTVLSSFIGLWFYHEIQGLKGGDGSTVTLNSPFLIAVQGMIYVGFVSAGLLLMIFLFVSPLFRVAQT